MMRPPARQWECFGNAQLLNEEHLHRFLERVLDIGA